jgi:hypothetical protein
MCIEVLKILAKFHKLKKLLGIYFIIRNGGKGYVSKPCNVVTRLCAFCQRGCATSGNQQTDLFTHQKKKKDNKLTCQRYAIYADGSYWSCTNRA